MQGLFVFEAPEQLAKGTPLPNESNEIRSAPKRHGSKTFDPVVHLEPGHGQGRSSPRLHKLQPNPERFHRNPTTHDQIERTAIMTFGSS